MTTFVISGSRGTDDPTMASLPFLAAKTARDQGHDAVLFLWNEAVTLARKGVAEMVVGVNLPALRDVLPAVQAAGVPIWVCAACAAARKVDAADLIEGASIRTMGDYLAAVAERDRNVSF